MGHRSVTVALTLPRESHVVGVRRRWTDGPVHRQVYGVDVADAAALLVTSSVLSVPILVHVIVELRLPRLLVPGPLCSVWLLVAVVLLLESAASVETTSVSAGAHTPAVVGAAASVHVMAPAGAGPTVV